MDKGDVEQEKYLMYNRFARYSVFDTVYSKAAIPIIETAIKSRNSPIQIAFRHSIQWSDMYSDKKQLSEYPFGHAEIWFGNNVGRVVQTDEGTFIATLNQSTKTPKKFEAITLPCKDPVAVFRVINELIHYDVNGRVGYGLYLLKLTNHILAELLDVDDLVERSHPDDELDPLDPSKWKHGVFCSQLVLLYLKACVLKDAIAIEDPQAKRHFLDTYTHTCTPEDLYGLALRTWPSIRP